MKEKETWEKSMTGIGDTRACSRALDLVAYLYGEADEAAARDFLSHTERCTSCQTELAAFGQVRVSIGEWREQALGSKASTVMATSSAVNVEPASVVAPSPRQRSAIAAIREFFTLSPVWMRAATAAFGVVFCALVALAVAHYLEQPKTATAERVVPVQPSGDELPRIVDEQARQRNLNTNAVAEANKPGAVIKKASASNINEAPPKATQVLRRDAARQTNLARNVTPKLKLSTRESREIARDLRLTIASNDEDDLPRLSDLIDESN